METCEKIFESSKDCQENKPQDSCPGNPYVEINQEDITDEGQKKRSKRSIIDAPRKPKCMDKNGQCRNPL